MTDYKSVAVLGSTGSIGTQALDIIEKNPDRLRVVTLAASTSIELLSEQIFKYRPVLVSVKGEKEQELLSGLIDKIPDPPVIVYGTEGLIRAAVHEDVTSVLNGLVGAVGLSPTLAALREHREVLLANKESLVMAGQLIRRLLESGCGSIVPVDSEHSAIYQCLGGRLDHPGISRILLTASGGPFHNRNRDDFEKLTVKEALSHPTWKMGPKITIDSATLMNKGLEIIEACYLFGLPPERIDVVIHPSSIVHSFVEFDDGCMLAQLSNPTMLVPIQYALLGGGRRPTGIKTLDLARLGKLEFFPPDSGKFPALELARLALKIGGTAPSALNGANEEAVKLFLEEKISFTNITNLVESALNSHEPVEPDENAVINADIRAREHVRTSIMDIIQ